MSEILQKIKNKWQTILLTAFLVTAVVFSVSAFIPPRHSSQVRMIIIQKHASEDVDAFSAAKSAEYLSDIVSKVVFTESFLKDVMDAPFEVEKNFPQDPEKKMEAWEREVEVDKVNNTGILKITVLDRSKEEARKIAESVAWSLNTRGSKYHGGGDSVEIKTIDGPITSQEPAQPNLLLNTVLGFLVGLIGSIAAVYYFEGFSLVSNGEREQQDRKKEKNAGRLKEKLAGNFKRSKKKEDLNYFNQEPFQFKVSEQDQEESVQEEDADESQQEEEEKKASFPSREDLGKNFGDLDREAEELEAKIKEEEEKEKADFVSGPKSEAEEKQDKKTIEVDRAKKADAPTNLPTMTEEEFMASFSNGGKEEGEETTLEKEAREQEEQEKKESEKEKSPTEPGFVSIDELEEEARKSEQQERKEEEEKEQRSSQDEEKEATEEEIKERLNKLLRGDL
ncbi:MAG: hypothetical protein U5L10_05310 [Candidatus Moranbacteria bacterium]|nr:hypothetical protein [Candidatus Moranbacteria bacterium]